MVCGRAGADEWSEDEVDEGETAGVDGIEGHQRFRWTAQLKADFRLELEKLIMLDWLMRNTDRGLVRSFAVSCTTGGAVANCLFALLASL
jgi:phosphatidylinositol 4-kinase type 2